MTWPSTAGEKTVPSSMEEESLALVVAGVWPVKRDSVAVAAVVKLQVWSGRVASWVEVTPVTVAV